MIVKTKEFIIIMNIADHLEKYIKIISGWPHTKNKQKQ